MACQMKMHISWIKYAHLSGIDVLCSPLGIMAKTIKISEFKRDYLSPIIERDVLKDAPRMFIWNLVNKLQEEHQLGRCLKEITSDSVDIIGKIPYFTASRVPYSETDARRNYQEIHALLANEIFNGITALPYSFQKFMELLLDNPIEDSYFIARHVGILPLSRYMTFIVNLQNLPPKLEHNVNILFYEVVDKVVISASWDSELKSEFESEDKFLGKVFTCKKDAYSTSCPSSRTYWLLRFLRNCIEHLGNSKRIKWKVDDVKRYKKWLEKNKHLNAFEKYCHEDVQEPEMTQVELLSILERRFPRVLADLQQAMHDDDLLQYMRLLAVLGDTLGSIFAGFSDKYFHTNQVVENYLSCVRFLY